MNRLQWTLTSDRLVYHYLRKQKGMSEGRLPKELKNSVVKRSKMDRVGQLMVRRMTGMVTNEALAVVKRFNAATGGKDDIAEKLEAVEETLGKEERILLQLLRSDSRKSLAGLMVDAGVRPTKVIERYAAGALALGKMEAAIEAAKEQPAIIKDLLRHALDQTNICETCVGSGFVNGGVGRVKENKVCPMCNGRKTRLSVSDHKEFATTQVMKFTKMIEEKPGMQIAVQQNVNVKGGNGSFMEKVLRTSDEVLYGRKEEIIDAETVHKVQEDSPPRVVQLEAEGKGA